MRCCGRAVHGAGSGRVTRARVRRRGVACVSRAGRVRGAAARGRTSICVHVDFFHGYAQY